MSETSVTTQIGPSDADLDAWLKSLAQPSPATDDKGRIDRIARLERLKGAVSAAQARETVEFKASQLAEQKAAGMKSGDLGKGLSAEVALARRESPTRGSRLVGLAEALVHEMPSTMAALTAGEISEWRAMIVAKETACLSSEDRRLVDIRLAGRLGPLSDKRVMSEARKIAYELDPSSIVARSRKALADRRVTIRPAPDTMTIVSALLPAAQGVAVYAALTRDADSKRASGDERSRGQVMADTLVERVTGQAKADQTPVEVSLVMTDRTLFAGDQTPALLEGYGPIPAPVARSLIRALDAKTKAWIRRLFTDPCTGLLTAIDPRRRLFKHALRRAVVGRDECCRTPWCGALIRHIDHVIAAEEGGETSETNGQGLCEACNYAKQAPGWRARPGPDGAGDSVTITTPSGHSYTSRPPPLPGAPPRSRSWRLPRIDVYGAA